MSVNKIVTHKRPHFDECLAIWLLRKFGKDKFPGVDAAKIDFAESDANFSEEGTLLIGIGGGIFDEHPTDKGSRKEGECAATLVAKHLGVDNYPALRKILKFAKDNDLNGSSDPFGLAYMVNIFHMRYPNNPEIVISWVLLGIEAKYHEQKNFWVDAKADFESKAIVEEIDSQKGLIKLVVIKSDNEQICKYARMEETGIIIQQNSNGNVQIWANKKFGLNICDIVKIIRVEEQKSKGKIITSDWVELSAEGKVAGAEEWYFFEKGQALFNGSLTAVKVPPTKIPLEKLVKMVKVGINPSYFYHAKCQQAKCLSTKQKACPFYKFGLMRCQENRK